MKGKVCACGREAVKKASGCWACQRCLDIENRLYSEHHSPHYKKMRRDKSVGVTEVYSMGHGGKTYNRGNHA